ncbi:hypothetical protein XENORESO_015339, partial [Xenotaenia resolanae]
LTEPRALSARLQSRETDKKKGSEEEVTPAGKRSCSGNNGSFLWKEGECGLFRVLCDGSLLNSLWLVRDSVLSKYLQPAESEPNTELWLFRWITAQSRNLINSPSVSTVTQPAVPST